MDSKRSDRSHLSWHLVSKNQTKSPFDKKLFFSSLHMIFYFISKTFCWFFVYTVHIPLSAVPYCKINFKKIKVYVHFSRCWWHILVTDVGDRGRSTNKKVNNICLCIFSTGALAPVYCKSVAPESRICVINNLKHIFYSAFKYSKTDTGT